MKKPSAAFLLTLALSLAAAGCTAGESPAKITDEASAPVVASAGAEPTEDAESGVDEAPTQEPVDKASTEEPVDETASLGDTVAVGDWDIKVTTVNLDAADVLAKANMFNDKAKGTFVLVTYEATYTGDERTADTLFDLTWTFTTTDNQVNDTASQVTPADDEEWPTEARKGGTVRGQQVFDLPKNRIKGGLLTVEGYDEDFETIYADFGV